MIEQEDEIESDQKVIHGCSAGMKWNFTHSLEINETACITPSTIPRILLKTSGSKEDKTRIING